MKPLIFLLSAVIAATIPFDSFAFSTSTAVTNDITFTSVSASTNGTTQPENHVIWQGKDTNPPLYRFNSKPRTQTLFSSAVRHGGFGSLVYGVTTINGEAAFMRGTRGAWIIHFADNHAIQLGLAGYRTNTDVQPNRWDHEEIDEPKVRTNYGGFEVEYVNRSHKLVHFSTQLLIGSGNVRYDDRDLELNRTQDNYFVLQPGVNANLNITNWFRISGGVYYRHAANVNLEGTSDSAISGITGLLGFRFGRF